MCDSADAAAACHLSRIVGAAERCQTRVKAVRTQFSQLRGALASELEKFSFTGVIDWTQLQDWKTKYEHRIVRMWQLQRSNLQDALAKERQTATSLSSGVARVVFERKLLAFEKFSSAFRRPRATVGVMCMAYTSSSAPVQQRFARLRWSVCSRGHLQLAAEEGVDLGLDVDVPCDTVASSTTANPANFDPIILRKCVAAIGVAVAGGTCVLRVVGSGAPTEAVARLISQAVVDCARIPTEPSSTGPQACKHAVSWHASNAGSSSESPSSRLVSTTEDMRHAERALVYVNDSP